MSLNNCGSPWTNGIITTNLRCTVSKGKGQGTEKIHKHKLPTRCHINDFIKTSSNLLASPLPQTSSHISVAKKNVCLRSPVAKEKLPHSKVIHHDRDQDKTNPRRLNSLPSTDFDMKVVKLAEVFLADLC